MDSLVRLATGLTFGNAALRARAVMTYTATPLGTLGGTHTLSQRIYASGQPVGYNFIAENYRKANQYRDLTGAKYEQVTYWP